MDSGSETGYHGWMDHIVTLIVPALGPVPALFPGEEPPCCGTVCVVERKKSSTLGTVRSTRPLAKTDSRPTAKLLRAATDEDLREGDACKAFEDEAMAAFAALAAKYALPMRAVRAHAFLGRNRIILWQSPQGPLPDLRPFEGELRRKIRCPIELREADARQTAALLGGCGCCGRELCCIAGRVPAEEPAPQRASALPASATGLCNCPRCCLGF